MHSTIRWTTPLNADERLQLEHWLDRATERYPGLLEQRHEAVVVRDRDSETVHSFAALTSAVIGRHPLAYALDEPEEQAAAPRAA
jgi:acyl dehydratase